MNTTALFVFILTLATSVLARPPIPHEADDYTDNNIVDSLTDEHEMMYDYGKDEERDFVLM